MRGMANFIVKHKLIFLIIFAVITVISVICFFFVNINSDIISYLPQDMTTSQGYSFLKKNFDMEGDAIIAIKGASYEDMKTYTDEMAKIEGIRSGGVIWYGYFDEMGAMGGVSMGAEIIDSIKKNPNVLKMFTPAEDIYTVMLQLSVPVSSNEATAVIENIKSMLNESGVEYAFGGSSAISTSLLSSVMNELWMYLLVAVLLVVIILLLTTKSFFEPVILLVTLGVSILINLGTNIIFPNISIITFATSSILQLALSMDYAIFLMHAYASEREKTLDKKEAMAKAIPKTFSTVCASALTTIGGFLALLFMQFEIGADLGVVLAKGVLLSLLTVVFLQPCLMLFCTKVLDGTEHKVYLPSFDGAARTTVRGRKVIAIIALMLVAPAIIGQVNVGYSYMKMEKGDAPLSETEQVVEVLGNSLMLCVPEDKPSVHIKYCSELSDLERVEAVNSIYSIIPEEYSNLIPLMKQLAPDIMKNYINNGYTLYFVMLNADSESVEGRTLLNDIKIITASYFDDYKIAGMTQAVTDLADITPQDFTAVTLISAAIIFIVLLITVRSLKYSLTLIGVVELGIVMNIAISYFLRKPINFMAYIIISSVQLGATIDYAILYTVKFKRYTQFMTVKQATYNALKDSYLPILTSATILAGVCFSVFFISSNQIIGEITMLIGRGAIISCLLVLLVLPSILIMITRRVRPPNGILNTLKIGTKKRKI